MVPFLCRKGLFFFMLRLFVKYRGTGHMTQVVWSERNMDFGEWFCECTVERVPLFCSFVFSIRLKREEMIFLFFFLEMCREGDLFIVGKKLL